MEGKISKYDKPDMKSKRRDQEEGGWQILTICLQISDHMIGLTCCVNKNISVCPFQVIK